MTRTHLRIGLLVTGECEERGMTAFLEPLRAEAGKEDARIGCRFYAMNGRPNAAQKFEQSRPRKAWIAQVVVADASDMSGLRNAPVPVEYEFAEHARRAFEEDRIDCLLVLDDVEKSRSYSHVDVFLHYRNILDRQLGRHANHASVQFLVLKLENYFFADPDATNAVLRGAGMTGEIPPDEGDVETITNASTRLHFSQIRFNYKKAEHGGDILARMDARRVLSDPATCASLRTLFAWCWSAMGLEPGPAFHLEDGALSVVTGPQLARIQPRSTAP